MAVDTTVNAQSLSTNAYGANEQPIDMFSKMFKNFPAANPLLAILTRLSTDELANSRIDWTEQEELPTRIIVTAAATAGETGLTIADHYTYLRNHDFLWNARTFELIKVEAFTTIDSSVPTIRGWGTSDAAAIIAGDELELVTSSWYEASEEATPRQPVNTGFHNFTAEIHEFVRTSDRVMNERTYFAGKGGKRLENQTKMLKAFKRKLENAIMFSYRADTASTESGKTSQFIKTMAGLIEKLKDGTNFMDVNGVLTESILDDYLTDFYAHMPDTESMACVCSPYLYTIINRMAKPLIRISPNSKRYGLQLKQYEGSIKLDLIPHPALIGKTMKGWMFLLDFDRIKLMYQQRPILELDVAERRNNYVEDKYSAMITLLLANEKAHGFVVGAKG